LKKRSDQDIVISQIPLNPPFSKGEVFLLPLAKGGGEGFYEGFFKALKCYDNPYYHCKEVLETLHWPSAPNIQFKSLEAEETYKEYGLC
jgi:hypothetical protein